MSKSLHKPHYMACFSFANPEVLGMMTDSQFRQGLEARGIVLGIERPHWTRWGKLSDVILQAHREPEPGLLTRFVGESALHVVSWVEGHELPVNRVRVVGRERYETDKRDVVKEYALDFTAIYEQLAAVEANIQAMQDLEPQHFAE